MAKTTKSKIRESKKCSRCFHNISQLKKLCHQKGLLTTFTKQRKSCSKHYKDIIIIHDSFKLSKSYRKSLTFAISAAFVQIQKAKLLKKREMNKDLSHLCAFSEEDIPDESDFQPIQTSIQSGHHIVAAGAEPEEVNNKSDSTEILFLETTGVQRINAENKYKFIPNEQDSLGLLNCTVTQVSQKLDSVNLWTQFGHPYVNELPASQYEIPGIGAKKEQLNWISPALSPISPHS